MTLTHCHKFLTPQIYDDDDDNNNNNNDNNNNNLFSIPEIHQSG